MPYPRSCCCQDCIVQYIPCCIKEAKWEPVLEEITADTINSIVDTEVLFTLTKQNGQKETTLNCARYDTWEGSGFAQPDEHWRYLSGWDVFGWGKEIANHLYYPVEGAAEPVEVEITIKNAVRHAGATQDIDVKLHVPSFYIYPSYGSEWIEMPITAIESVSPGWNINFSAKWAIAPTLGLGDTATLRVKFGNAVHRVHLDMSDETLFPPPCEPPEEYKIANNGGYDCYKVDTYDKDAEDEVDPTLITEITDCLNESDCDCSCEGTPSITQTDTDQVCECDATDTDRNIDCLEPCTGPADDRWNTEETGHIKKELELPTLADGTLIEFDFLPMDPASEDEKTATLYWAGMSEGATALSIIASIEWRGFDNPTTDYFGCYLSYNNTSGGISSITLIDNTTPAVLKFDDQDWNTFKLEVEDNGSGDKRLKLSITNVANGTTSITSTYRTNFSSHRTSEMDIALLGGSYIVGATSVNERSRGCFENYPDEA